MSERVQILITNGMQGKLQEWIHKSQPAARSTPTIFKVPTSVRSQDDQAFEPEVISIGPLHHDKPQLKPMECMKWSYLYDFIARSPEDNKLEKYVSAIHTDEGKARNCYLADEFKLSSKDFVEMLVLDGCFIIELLLKCHLQSQVPSQQQEIDDVMSRMSSIRIDMLLIENQIPFFVLMKLFELSTIPAEEGIQYPSLLDLASEYVSAEETKVLEQEVPDVCHLLHLSHMCNSQGLYPEQANPHTFWRLCNLCDWKMITDLLSLAFVSVVYFLVYILLSCGCSRCFRRRRQKGRSVEIPCAKELSEAGVQFKRKEEGNRFQPSFKEGTLSIPEWHIDKRTKSYFWNLMAFQKCKRANKDFFNFAIYMSFLMCTESDVEILEKKRIVQNNLGSSDELINFFKNLSRGGMPHHAKLLFGDVINYYGSRQIQWKAKMASDFAKLVPHYKNPWIIASVVVACLLIGLSVTQGIYSILKYYSSSD